MAFVEALKTRRLPGNAPVDLVLDASIGILVLVSSPPCALVTEQGREMGISLTHILHLLRSNYLIRICYDQMYGEHAEQWRPSP